MILTLVSTPIGNLEDITLRALNALKNSAIVLAEDTRVTKKLFEALEIDYSDKKIMSFNDHDQAKIPAIYRSLEGKEVTLVSDAGSPVVSDPAYPLIRYLLEAGGTLATVPGVSAPTCALELSGLPSLPNTFHGFIGRKKGEILTKFEECQSIGGLHIFFESPHRILDTIEILAEFSPESQVSVSREITKKFETTHRFLAKDFKTQEILDKGEFVFCVWFEKSSAKIAGGLDKLAQAYLDKKTPKNLAKLIAPILNLSTNEVYQKITE
ncbi:16S rRNA (cytidine(1402)-2'-O)-methyltransferase [Bacteriovorax sp. Seq25_V]|uniref:16S rRNA (cytidine(1402)-2'-O)-methyltransferase n=1 Tax=Bacteriovorax sp. Seq25_V TaxID=1201288 RepID=UPI00038A497C|nr:16S rRNA (cytidine(1402)-2'-O)-methyltransferase [Bacteriovorax sp. Seq25_V]EQC44328.1 S-adenosylmethionine-dependent methyltransferase, YraL family [Bacteriovorax sp. Seq25_V]